MEFFTVTEGVVITSPQLLGIGDDGTPYILVVDDGEPSTMYILNGFAGNVITSQVFTIGDIESNILPGVQPVVSNFSFVLTAGASTNWSVTIT